MFKNVHPLSLPGSSRYANQNRSASRHAGQNYLLQLLVIGSVNDPSFEPVKSTAYLHWCFGIATRMWVRPADLFRPCTQVDPLIPTCPQLVTNTIAAGVDRSAFLFNQAAYSWRLQRKGTATRISCAQDFRNTMKGNCFGFPWTRLGYTYDWTPGARYDRGVTEFVIAPGSRVILDSTGPAIQLEAR